MKKTAHIMLLPLLAGAVSIFFVLTHWRAVVREESVHIGRITEMAASSVKNEIAYELNSRINALVRMAKRGERIKEPTREEWETDAELYIQHYSGYQALEWLAPSLNVRWSVPAGRRGEWEGRREGFLSSARDLREAFISHPVDLPDGGRGFEVSVPILRNRELGGYIVGVLRFRELLDSIIFTGGNYRGYDIFIHDGGEEVYRNNRQALLSGKAKHGEELKLYGATWRITVSPTPATLAEIRSPLPKVVLAGGISLSVLLALAAYLAQEAWLRQRKSEEANLRLVREIDDHRRTEKVRERLSKIIETTSDFVGTSDADGKVLYINKAGRRMLGIGDDEDVSGVRIPDTHPGWATEIILKDALPIALREGIWSGETAFLGRDGREIRVLQVVMAHRGEDGAIEYLSTIARDITERKRLQEQLLQSHKMEAVGRLAAGIAHDFNNILSIIGGYSELIQMKLKEDDPLLDPVNQIASASAKGAGLVKGLMSFTRRQPFNPKTLDLNLIVLEVEQILSMIIGEGIDLRLSLFKGPVHAHADGVLLEQVLINLVTNARDAIYDGGKIVIGTELTGPRDGEKGSGAGRALLYVADNGTGMDEGMRKRAFEPFFTTKEEGKGTGLGLSNVMDIVKMHTGRVEVESVPGSGTTVRIYLPAETVAHSKMEREAAASTASVGGLETVMVAEDDAAVRDCTVAVLREFGYNVISAGDGEEAVALFEKRRDDIRLVILDCNMPKKSGIEAFEEIRAIRPDIAALFVSGYPGDIMQKIGGMDSRVRFMPKPLKPEALIVTIRELLDGGGPNGKT